MADLSFTDSKNKIDSVRDIISDKAPNSEIIEQYIDMAGIANDADSEPETMVIRSNLKKLTIYFTQYLERIS